MLAWNVFIFVCVVCMYDTHLKPTGLVHSEAHELLPSKKLCVRILYYCLRNFVCMFAARYSSLCLFT